MENHYANAIKNASSLSQMLKTVNEIVLRFTGFQRDEILLEIQDLGFSQSGFIGAYYSYSENKITLNASPLRALAEHNVKLLKYYTFHVLLHEYIHAVGVMNESDARRLTYNISKEYFGEKHVLTKMAQNNLLMRVPIVTKARVKQKQSWDLDTQKELFDEFDRFIEDAFNRIHQLIRSMSGL